MGDKRIREHNIGFLEAAVERVTALALTPGVGPTGLFTRIPPVVPNRRQHGHCGDSALLAMALVGQGCRIVAKSLQIADRLASPGG